MLTLTKNLFIVFVVAAICFLILVAYPWLAFWAINALFGFKIYLTFKTWLAAWVLLWFVRGEVPTKPATKPTTKPTTKAA